MLLKKVELVFFIIIQVPKDSTTEQTILTCLEELDRCFEDNGQPFFIGLISDK
jgi:nephrocystin-3